MKLKIFFIILALLVFCSTCKSPESPDDQITNGDQTSATGTISGTVTDANTSAQLSGASVSTTPATTTATTNALGNYTISNVSPGSYTVTASASGYMDDSTSVAVTAGQTATADLMLQADYSGSWIGTTTQGREISFTIVNNAFTRFKFGFSVSGSGCTTSGTVEITYSVPQTFSGNTFTISGSAYQMTYSFSGTFDSSTTASGSGSVTTTGGCYGTASFTWSANKN